MSVHCHERGELLDEVRNWYDMQLRLLQRQVTEQQEQIKQLKLEHNDLWGSEEAASDAADPSAASRAHLARDAQPLAGASATLRFARMALKFKSVAPEQKRQVLLLMLGESEAERSEAVASLVQELGGQQQQLLLAQLFSNINDDAMRAAVLSRALGTASHVTTVSCRTPAAAHPLLHTRCRTPAAAHPLPHTRCLPVT